MRALHLFRRRRLEGALKPGPTRRSQQVIGPDPGRVPGDQQPGDRTAPRVRQLGAGILETTQLEEKLRENLPWFDDFSPGSVKFIGVVEFLGALGLVLPRLTGIAPVLTRWRRPGSP